MLVGWLEIPLTPELIYEISFTISYVTIPLKRIQISRVQKEILKKNMKSVGPITRFIGTSFDKLDSGKNNYFWHLIEQSVPR